jgi:hypothetical protein
VGALASLAECTFAFAVLDLSLAGILTYPVADALRSRGTPFIFATGYGASGLAQGYEGETALKKPFGAGDPRKTSLVPTQVPLGDKCYPQESSDFPLGLRGHAGGQGAALL